MNIITECYAETYLLKFLEYSPRHQNKGGMSKVISRVLDSDIITIGVIDNDIMRPKSDDRFMILDSSNRDLLFFKHKQKELYLVKQNPDFEGWIFNISKKHNLLPKNTKFKSVRDLKDVTKHEIKLRRDKQFNDLLKSIRALENSPFNDLRDFFK